MNNRNIIKSVLDFISNEENVKSILPKISDDAPELYEGFFSNILDMYIHINDKYKEKVVDVIINELSKTNDSKSPLGNIRVTED